MYIKENVYIFIIREIQLELNIQLHDFLSILLISWFPWLVLMSDSLLKDLDLG